MSNGDHEWELDTSHEGSRLDVVISSLLKGVSRSRVQKWIGEGHVTVNDKPARTSHRCRQGETLHVRVPEPEPASPTPEPIPLAVLYEDRDLLIVDKKAGMVVHPAPGHTSGTLVNGLLHHCRDLAGIGDVLRPGIVHRLDRGTSGLMVVAKNDSSHEALSLQFQQRLVEKLYIVLVYGDLPAKLALDTPIGRDRKDRKKISSRSDKPRPALSEVSRLERLPMTSLAEVRIRTGRTHQIRVHLSEAGFPVVGDPDYPGQPANRASITDQTILVQLKQMSRPALHARVLAFSHPSDGRQLRFETEYPEDMKVMVDALRKLRD